MTENYGKPRSGGYNKIKRRITGAVIIVILIIAAAWAIGVLAGDSAEYQERSSILQENHRLLEENEALKQQTETLQAQINELQSQVYEKDAYIAALPTETPAPEETQGTGELRNAPVDNNAVSPRN